MHNFIFFRFSMGFVDSIIAKCKEEPCFSAVYLPGAKRNNSRPNTEFKRRAKTQRSHSCVFERCLSGCGQADGGAVKDLTLLLSKSAQNLRSCWSGHKIRTQRK